MPNEFIYVATEDQVRIKVSPNFVYEPSPFHGTKRWVKLTPPVEGDPFKRFKD